MEKINVLPTDYQQFIATSRYTKWLPEKRRRETWEETIERYFDFFEGHLEQFTDYTLNNEIKNKLETAISNFEIMPSMRCLMTAGKALEQNSIAGYNCAYLTIDHPKAFDEILYVLMHGTGIGFSVERQFINQLPSLPSKYNKVDDIIVVQDSKEGWQSAYRKLISYLYNGEIPNFNYSKVRKKGSRLKTFGGRASGPEPLKGLFEFTINLFTSAHGQKLTSYECHKLACKIAEIVVCGGVRRSALISLSNLTDERMRRAKSGQWWVDTPEMALSNNSVCYTEKPDIGIFMKEWLSLYESKSGERGIFNRQASEAKLKSIDRKIVNGIGCNPCCFTGDMKLLTQDGYQRFEKLSKDDNIVIVNSNGDITNGMVWSTGIKSIVEIKFLSRDGITCTEDHIFLLNDGTECQAKDLKGKRVTSYINQNKVKDKDAFLAGFILGDGILTRLNSKSHKGLDVIFGQDDGDIASLYGKEIGTWYSKHAFKIAMKYELKAAVTYDRDIPLNNHLFIKNINDFIMGMFSANGSVITNHRVALKTTSLDISEQLVSVLKKYFDITSYITTNKAKKVKFSNGDYICKRSYDVNISKVESIIKFANSISFEQKYKRLSLHNLIVKKSPFVCSVKGIGKEEVFDFTEPKTHWGVVNGLVVHNSEIILRPMEFCNLSEVVIRASDNKKDIIAKVVLATILGTFQASLINIKGLRSKWKHNIIEEALLGVSLTGIMDNILTNGTQSKEALIKFLKQIRQVAKETNIEWAAKLGINPAAAITCVKPSGTVSQLVDSASGIHARHSQYYIRTVRADIKDPLARLMQDSGIPCESDVMKPESTLVFSFPIKAPDNCVTRDDKTAIEQLELWNIYNEYYCDHKPSVTINLKEHEWLQVGNWVYENFDSVSGISFLPYSDHVYQQAPYQEITEDEYLAFLDKMPKKGINWVKLSDYEQDDDNVAGIKELACSGNSCENVDLT